jgi:NitT/TauT family transport system substrate-binding protein
MRTPHAAGWTRRRFLGGLTLAGTAGLLGLYPRPSAAEPPPETTTLRIFDAPALCTAPHYVAQDLLDAEGFTDIRYIKYLRETQLWVPENLLSGEVDISLSFPPHDITSIDAGTPVVILAGTHSGCVEVIGNDRVRSTRELKGKTVAIGSLGDDQHIFISMFAKYVGLDPHTDINWLVSPYTDQLQLFTEGKIDAFFTSYPDLLQLRAKKIGHVLVSTTTDKPWSQYVCCLVATTKEFVRQHPVATKRALRALLKATQMCATEPTRVARLIADKGIASYDGTLQMLRELPYGVWREYDPEDAVRFYALWLREVGMIQSTPQQIIAQGTDWRSLHELKKELKG